MELKLHELLPHAAYIDILDWDSSEYEICTDLFEGIPDEGLDFSGTLDYLLGSPTEFTVHVTKRTTVSDIIDAIRKAYHNATPEGLENFSHFDLILIGLMVNLEERRFETTFLETR